MRPRMATRDQTRDVTAVTERSEVVQKTWIVCGELIKEKRRFYAFSSDKYSLYEPSPQTVDGDAREARDGTSVTKRQRSGLTPFATA